MSVLLTLAHPLGWNYLANVVGKLKFNTCHEKIKHDWGIWFKYNGQMPRASAEESKMPLCIFWPRLQKNGTSVHSRAWKRRSFPAKRPRFFLSWFLPKNATIHLDIMAYWH